MPSTNIYVLCVEISHGQPKACETFWNGTPEWKITLNIFFSNRTRLMDHILCGLILKRRLSLLDLNSYLALLDTEYEKNVQIFLRLFFWQIKKLLVKTCFNMLLLFFLFFFFGFFLIVAKRYWMSKEERKVIKYLVTWFICGGGGGRETTGANFLLVCSRLKSWRLHSDYSFKRKVYLFALFQIGHALPCCFEISIMWLFLDWHRLIGGTGWIWSVWT